MPRQYHHSSNWGGKREGAGSKVRGKTPVKPVLITLPEHLIEALDKECGRTSTPRSTFIAEVLSKKLKISH